MEKQLKDKYPAVPFKVQQKLKRELKYLGFNLCGLSLQKRSHPIMVEREMYFV